MSDNKPFEGWVVLELLGHRRLGGYLTEHEIAGTAFLRIDVPAVGDVTAVTQFVAPASVYAITPTTEEIARVVARSSRPAPVSLWELRELPAPAQSEIVVVDDDDADDDDVPF